MIFQTKIPGCGQGSHVLGAGRSSSNCARWGRWNRRTAAFNSRIQSELSWHTVPAVCRSKHACSLKRRSSRYQKQKRHLFQLFIRVPCDHCSRSGLATSVFKYYGAQVPTLFRDSRHITSANPPTRFPYTSPASWGRKAAFRPTPFVLTLDIFLLTHAQAAETKQPLLIHRVPPFSHLLHHSIANSNT